MKFSSETSISACDNIQEMEDDYDEDEETEEVEDIPDRLAKDSYNYLVICLLE